MTNETVNEIYEMSKNTEAFKELSIILSHYNFKLLTAYRFDELVFITFEGGEGSGKTTIANMIQKTLAQEGYHVVLTREPGGVEIAEKIRDIIHDVKYINMDRKTEALLYAESR